MEECYECSTEKGDTNCGDPFDTANAKGVKCSELNYQDTRKSGILNKFRSLIVVKDNEQFKYACAKAVVEVNSTLTYTRTCVRTVTEVHNDCDLLIEESDSFSEVIHCSICNDQDNCNSGSYLTQSIFLFALSTFLVYYCM